MRILVPVDGSRFSERALAYAGVIAGRAHATLHLATVQEDPPLLRTPAIAPFPATAAAVSSPTDDYLERLARPWRADAHDVLGVVLHGPVAPALAEYTVSAGIDLVIMTTHGRGGLSRAWLGSVADRLVRSINTPVLLLRPGEDRIRPLQGGAGHILIPLDGSAASESIIESAVRLGDLLDARYTLMQVIPPPLATASPYEAGATFEIDAQTARSDALEYLEDVARRLRADGHVVHTVVVMQWQSAAGILEEAVLEDCTMIAMATHGRTGWARLALGSVADKVLRGAPAPVLMLRPEAAAQPAWPREAIPA